NFETGAYTYTAGNVDQDETETFTYTVVDSDGTPATADLVVNVNDVDTAVLARNDAIRTNVGAGGTLIIPAAALLFNDFSFEGMGLSIASVQNASDGTATIVPGGVQFSLGPAQETGSFEYTAQSNGSTDDALVNIQNIAGATLAG